MVELGDIFEKSLKNHGYSLTQARKAVFEALVQKETQTMRELVELCQGKVDRASVYRTVALFEGLGIVQRLQIGWKYKLELTDKFSHHHHHLTCLNCGQTFPLPEDAELESRLHKLAKSKNFAAQDHQLEIRGLCQNCQTTNS
ncbi:MAG TPA: Fur family transcriptional regulator [Candidatus Saccharimonadales bacterium]|nr:Fur family transcriptional regulator [Candidatus Saccharimonadales bacterium]